MHTGRLSLFLVSVLACTYLAVGLLGSNLIGMHSSHERSGRSGDCPFMVGAPMLCQMNALEHAASWQELFLALLPDFIALLFLIGISYFFLRASWPLSAPPPRVWFSPPPLFRNTPRLIRNTIVPRAP